MSELTESRVARRPSPLPCFGLEYDLRDERCQQCPHNSACAVHSESRANKVPLDLVKVQLKEGGPIDIKKDDLNQYIQATVSRMLGQTVKKLSEAQLDDLDSQAADLGVEPRLYVMAVVTGHKVSSPDRQFYASHLTGPIAAKRVQLYRGECASRYGMFDQEALSRVTQVRGHPKLQDSEDLAAAYVIGHCARLGGDALACLYEDRELGLDPLWLATEPTYSAWVRSTGESTDEVEKHRRHVAQAKKWSSEAAKSRNACVLPAIRAALETHYLSLSDFYGPEVVTNAAKLWVRLGYAIARMSDLSNIAGFQVEGGSSIDGEF